MAPDQPSTPSTPPAPPPAPTAATPSIPALPADATKTAVKAAEKAVDKEEAARLAQQGLRCICLDCSTINHMDPGGALGCARLEREREIADANGREDPEEAKAVRAQLLLPDRPAQMEAYAKRVCPVLRAWDDLRENGTEPDTDAVRDTTKKFLEKAGLPPFAK